MSVATITFDTDMTEAELLSVLNDVGVTGILASRFGAYPVVSLKAAPLKMKKGAKPIEKKGPSPGAPVDTGTGID